jgi:hypothetical protein
MVFTLSVHPSTNAVRMERSFHNVYRVYRFSFPRKTGFVKQSSITQESFEISVAGTTEEDTSQKKPHLNGGVG